VQPPFRERYARGESIPDGVGLVLLGFDLGRRAEQLTSIVQFASPTDETQPAWRALEEVFKEERLRASGALDAEE
jgi:hypothetical protein